MRAPSRRALVAAALAVVAGVYWLWPAPSDADQVRAVVHAVAEAAEEGDVGDVMAHVSPRYAGSESGVRLDERQLRAALALQFLRRGPVAVLLSPIEVTVSGDTAHARFDAAVTEGSPRWTDLLPRAGDGWHLEVDFVREDGVWRVVGHTRSSWLGEGPPVDPTRARDADPG